MFYLEYFASQAQFEDFFELFQSTFEFFSKDFLQETLTQLFAFVFTYILQKDCSVVLYKKTMRIFCKRGLKIDLNLVNKLLDQINKNGKDEDFLKATQAVIEENNIELDVKSYNILMEHYCSVGQFSEAMKMFQSLPEKQIQPDSYSYSVLIEGLKSCPE